MKVLVTGATGFIGNYVVDELLKRGYDVIATSVNPNKALELHWFNKVKYIPFDQGNFKDEINYFDFFEKPDLLIHLAWQGLPNYKDEFHVAVNLPQHYNFLNNIISNGLRDVTITGTCLEYGLHEGELNETMLPVEPLTKYAEAKLKLFNKLSLLQNDLPFNLKWVRLFYMYGKGQNPNAILSQLDKAIANNDTVFNMSGGEQQRDYLTVEEVAKIIIDVAVQQKVSGVINCASGKPVTIKSFVEGYLKSKQQSIHLNLGHYPYTTYEPMRFWGSVKKLNSIYS